MLKFPFISRALTIPPATQARSRTSPRWAGLPMAEFILGTSYPSETNYMSETGNSSTDSGDVLTDESTEDDIWPQNTGL